MKKLSYFWVLSLSLIALHGQAKTWIDNYCDSTLFTCIKVEKKQSWQSLFPDVKERDIVKRINRTNRSLRQGMRIAIPHDLSTLTLNDLAPFEGQIEPIKQKLIYINEAALAWAAYDEEGRLVKWGPVSTGRRWCGDIESACRTPKGDFTLLRKRGAGCESSQYPINVEGGGAPMPYCMFFHNGYALHGSNSVPGYPASHGCVRLFTEDAKWLNESFVDLPGQDKIPTRVMIE